MGDILIWSLVAAGIVVGVLLLIMVIGTFLPREHEVARSITLKQAPETIWRTITDYPNVPGWHPGVLKVERLPDKNGREVWRETYKGDYGIMLETAEAIEPTRLVRTIADESGPFTGRWEFALSKTDAGCRLTITEFGAIPNPFFRVMARLYMKPEMYVELYLRALAQKFGEPALFV